MCLPKMQAGMEVSNRDGLHIRKASGENWRSIAALSVSGKQQSYIESNAYSLAESVFEPNWCSVGLYDGETLVGFAMYGTGPEQKEVWLDRFMIDSRFQGQGYARRFLPVLIGCIKNQYECDAIYLSVTEDNGRAQKLYGQFGFKKNWEIDDTGLIVGVVMVLQV